MKKYDPKKIEPKWQKYWDKQKTFEALENAKSSEGTPLGEKFYGLIEFPYPSGEGLHVGHPRPFTAMDVITRKKRMEGKNVLFPIGFDAFGLPTENFAIKTGKPPAEVTKKNIANFTRQLKMLGFGFDWSRQVDTTDPNYYKWTQWLFLQFYKHGLAYKKNQPINWCPKDKIGLANEEVVGGCCERCGTAVEKRNKEQWMLGITKYADKLLEGLKDVNYIERARVQQENWIGKSEGAEVVFPLRVPGQADGAYSVTVFTTRPDTIFGVTFLAISPELAKSWLDAGWKPSAEVVQYIDQELKNRAAITTREEQEKTGVHTDVLAVNPVSKESVPVWVTNYVMGGVGTGALMGVPAHDERDFDFAKKFGLPVRQVVNGNAEIEEKTKYLIFDFDGVLGDTKMPSLKVFVNMGETKTEQEALEDQIAYFSRKPKYVKDHNLTAQQIQEKSDWVKRFGDELVKVGFSLFDGFIEVIKEMPKTKIAIISSGSSVAMKVSGIKEKLSATHILSFEDHHSKEEKIEQVCKDWGVSLKDVYYFTDTKSDVYELENCLDRKKIIGCAWGYCGYDLLKEVLPEKQILKEFAEIQTLFGAELFTEDGVSVNSDFLNGLKTSEAQEKIISWLEENKVGKKQINYKLRDWVFSRQRYWGEPIPLVYCENCKNKKQKALLIHGFESSGDGVWLPWMKKELEKQGFEVFNPSMTNNFHATVDSWLAELKPYFEKLGEDDVIIAHSLGSKAALHLLEQAAHKVGHIFLVASAIGTVHKRDWDQLRAKWPKSDIDALQAFWGMPVNYEKINQNAKTISVIRSSDDHTIPFYTHEGLPASWFVQTWNGFGHFLGLEYPKLLAEVLMKKNTGWAPLPESELPLKLPKVEQYQPTDTGESPLAAMEKWVKTKCPNCGGAARRETDTMPNWAGSSWYFLAYALGGEKRLAEQNFWDQELLKQWMPVDWYNGGMEHTVLHLLYSRFWNQFLYDVGFVPSSEPYKKRTSHGMILAKGGEKMSKSRGNVVNPDEMVEQFGADALRTYIMFMGPFDQAVEWDTNGLVGVRRFLEKVWSLQEKNSDTAASDAKTQMYLHQTIKKVTEDIDDMRFNTAIAKMMELANEMSKQEKIAAADYILFVKILSPFAPHLCEEIWSQLGNNGSIALEAWPEYNEALTKEQEITLAVQINGKLRDTISVDAEITEAAAKEAVLASQAVQKWLEGKEPKKIIYVKGKLISIVV